MAIDHTIRTAAVELDISEAMVRYYCRTLKLGIRAGRAPSAVYALTGQDIDAIAEHMGRKSGPAPVASVAQPGPSVARDAGRRYTTTEVAGLLGIGERAVLYRARSRGVGERVNPRLLMFSAADLAELRRPSRRGRPRSGPNPAA